MVQDFVGITSVASRPMRAKRVTGVQCFLWADHLSPYTNLVESSGATACR